MLRALHIRDYALIEQLDLEFEEGLNIITGQTGTGKSILVGAMEMIVGERASTDVIRSGASKSVVEGVFGDADLDPVERLLEDHGVEAHPSGELIMRREIRSTQSRAFINDTPATVQLMREVASHLVDLHGQHEHQSLLRTETHLRLLDSFGELDDRVERYRTCYDRMRELVDERDDLLAREEELRQKRELVEFQMEEIDEVDPRPGEEEELENERRVLSNAEELYESTARIVETLYEGDQSAYEQLTDAHRELEELREIDDTFEEHVEELGSAAIVVSELSKFLQEYNQDVTFQPERLEEIRTRIGEIERLKRKYGGSLEAVLEHRAQIQETYELATSFEASLDELAEEIEQTRAELSRTALELSRRRRETAEAVEDKVEDELARLGIKNARFEVRFEIEPDEEGWIQLPDETDAPVSEGARARAFEHGLDRVEFYLSTNVGEEPKPLVEVASGGEVSRIMLALKTILARNERLPILVFDEIDVGISGSIARKVGRAMYELADSHQIIAITHLPQIASLADRHFGVEKEVEDGRTRTLVRSLTDRDRTREVAALISGADVTDAALENARELMASPQN